MKGKKEKKEFDQNIGLHEVFLESVPSALIIFVIWLKAFGNEILMIFVTHVLIMLLQGEVWILSSSLTGSLLTVTVNSS